MLKSRETAIHGALLIERAPRIILGLGGSGEHGRRDYTEYDQRSLHEARAIRGRGPIVINRLTPRFIPVPLLQAALQLAVKKARRTERAAGRRKFRNKIER